MRIEFKEWVTPAIVGVASFITGIGVGYAISKTKASRARIDDVAEKIDEIASKLPTGSVQSEAGRDDSVNTQLQFQYDDNLDRMNSAIQQAHHVILKYADDGRKFLKDSVAAMPRIVIPEIQHDDVRPEDIGWDYTEEVKTRSEDRPYIIHRDEYFANENDYTQSSLTFYKGDEILCDELDVPVYNPEKVVGKLIFGHGSGDPSICYVRNEKTEAEWEIILDEGYYQSEVLGAQVEDDLTSDDLKHGLPKFRTGD